MNRSLRTLICRLVGVLAGVVLLSASTVATVSAYVPPDPRPDPVWVGSIHYGAIPPQRPDGPVLVFVHGYGGTAGNWWTVPANGQGNDMYAMAYGAGYRTAFVDLGGRDGQDSGTMWSNGQLLSWQLETIAEHYGVEILDIVAHSKGGIDSQAAVVHYGGWRLVRRVFTLSSPHQGSELADLLYSDWAFSLAPQLGLLNDATFTLQTSYMQAFRATTDPQVAGQDVRYYTAAGTDAGSQFSGLWLSGIYLSPFGPNDGAVTLASTVLPSADTPIVLPVDHYEIKRGHTAFPWIDAALRGSLSHLHMPLIMGPDQGSPEPGVQSQLVRRGGMIRTIATAKLPIESGVLKVTVDLMVPKETVTATVTTPDGLSHPMQLIPPTGEGLLGSVTHLVHVEDSPVAGEWTFTMKSPSRSAYLLVAKIDSPLVVTLDVTWGDAPSRQGTLWLRPHVEHNLGRPRVHDMKGSIRRVLPEAGANDPLLRNPCWQRGNSEVEWAANLKGQGICSVELPPEEGIYVVSLTVKGEMPDGTDFERSFVRSLGVATRDTDRRVPATLLESSRETRTIWPIVTVSGKE